MKHAFEVKHYDVRDDRTIQDEIVFKGHQIVVPFSLRKELIEVTHASKIGIKACIQRAKESLHLLSPSHVTD